MYSLDVVSLLINVPAELVLILLLKDGNVYPRKKNFLLEEFLIAIHMVLNSIFTFNNKFYKQIFRISMRSLLSPFVADMVI